MSETAASVIWCAAGLYAAVGLAAALWMHAGALRRIDPLAATAPLGARLLITPGLVALWPLMLAKHAGARQ